MLRTTSGCISETYRAFVDVYFNKDDVCVPPRHLPWQVGTQHVSVSRERIGMGYRGTRRHYLTSHATTIVAVQSSVMYTPSVRRKATPHVRTSRAHGRAQNECQG